MRAILVMNVGDKSGDAGEIEELLYFEGGVKVHQLLGSRAYVIDDCDPLSPTFAAKEHMEHINGMHFGDHPIAYIN